MKNIISIAIILSISITHLTAQMIVGNDTLYGNEWINHSQSYLKIQISTDGVYRIDQTALTNAGVPTGSLTGLNYQIFHLGKEIPLRTSTDNAFNTSDYIEFYGQQNRAAIDSFLFQNPTTQLLNPYYSLVTDTSAYYLTWNSATTGLRYQSINNNITNPPVKEAYFLREELQEFHSTWIKKRSSGYIYDSYYDIDGFLSSFKATRTINFNVPHIYTIGSVNSHFRIRLAVKEDGIHNQKIKLNGTTYIDESYTGFKLKDYSITVPTATLLPSTALRVENNFDNRDRQGIAFFRLTYPSEFNFDNRDQFQFSIEASTTDKYIEIQNFNATGASPILYDLTNNITITTTYDATNNLVQFLLPPSNEKRQLLLFNPSSAIQNVTSLIPTNFVNFAQMDGNYIVISNKRLYNDPNNGTNWAQKYVDYRSSVTGGGYNAVLVDIEDLYEQFAYGVARHPISIRNFSHYIKKNWTSPKYVFLIGKGIEYSNIRTDADYAAAYHNFFIPTYGFVGADNLLFSAPNNNIPIFSIGRLAASTPNQVNTYLRKVTLYENSANLPQTLAAKGWMKKIAHLGGGNTSGEQSSIKNSLNQFKSIIENNQYGGNVSSVFKTSGDPIQISQTEQLTELINNGVSVMTFFGHAYAGGFDVSLDEPGFYENEGRLPIIMSYGCYSGRIHDNASGISENFIFEENKGGIAFISSSGLATIPALSTFGKEFYKQLGGDNYNKGIGDVVRATNINTQNSTGYTTSQMTIHGDPALRINTHETPDYLIDASSVEFTPSSIDIQEDSFNLSFEVVNIGRNLEDTSILVKIIQELPNGNIVDLVIDTIAAPGFSQFLSYRLPTLGETAIGLNTFKIEVDFGDRIQELPLLAAESNNTLVDNNGTEGVRVYMTSSNINPLFPINFGIVGQQNIILKAAPTNTLAPMRTYIFELDTTPHFNSPLKLNTSIAQAGGLVEWQPSITYQDSVVYYWRVSPDSISAAGYIWQNSSFIYINNIPKGWNQSHFYQFEDDQYSNMRLKSNTRTIEFIDDFKDLIAENLINTNGLDKTECFFNNNFLETYRQNVMSNTDLFIVVLDSFTAQPWLNPSGGLYGSINTHGSRSYKAFAFKTDTKANRDSVVNFLENIVPINNYVLLMTLQDNETDTYYPDLWAADSSNINDTNIFQVLENQGATEIRSTQTKGSLPYILFYQKSDNIVNLPLFEQLADTITEKISMSVPIIGSWDNGSVESSLIGPASSWQTLKWQAISPDHPDKDHYSIQVIGIKTDKTEEIIYNNIAAFDTTLSGIDATIYPYIKLKYNSLDTATKSSAHLKHWRVLYQGIPELAIVPNKHFSFYNDTLQRGEILNFEIAVQNISDYQTDSILVKYNITDVDNNQFVNSQRLKLLNSNDTLKANFQFDTKDLKELNTFTFEVNPDQDQPELYHFNNTAIQSFYVKQDQRHPLLDVTFDGSHIIDGDIVSAQPQILIALKDENPYLALNDTALFKVWIVDPVGIQQRYYMDGQSMIFYPADENNLREKNLAKLEVNPKFEIDGVYQLIVQAQDRSGNASGSIDYKVSFEIITASSISYVLNYPNPFTTSTQFVFTLTGNQIPDDMRIQIYTVSGRLVKEISKEELGNIRIGQNRTDYRWDGTDQFGDRLANGVYLYRVTATINGEELDNFYTKATPYFQNGFGKMVLMR